MRFVAFDFFSLWYLSLNGFVVFRRFFIQWGVSHFRVYRLMGFVTICGLSPIIGSVCRLLDLSLIRFVTMLNIGFVISWVFIGLSLVVLWGLSPIVVIYS